MKVNMFTCLLAFILLCSVTAGISHRVLEEKKSVTLSCPQSVEGEVTWSRETNGHKVDLLKADDDRETRYNDPRRRFGSSADKSLHIRSVTVSDTGRYFCNDEAAVDLTVIPSGTDRHYTLERTTVELTCPHDVGGSDVPSWSRDGRQIDGRRVSRVNKMLTIRDVQPGDSGLYYCDGKAAVYLKVTEGDASERGYSTTTATTTQTKPDYTRPTTVSATTRQVDTTTTKKPQNTTSTVRTVIGILYLIIMTSITVTVTVWTKAQKKQSGHTVETEYVL
ncbi:neural cell adhesion molecule 2-like [Larimichthys crocea]|uniref:neural cell adhesion molecule 2-like n=1 Tax=Larimichthys crocea TaxID=215358 RepID=UPI000F5D965E|nr:neural cell adhesion molecule 2-like [Larimichthys crocea]